jgi:hypothetical protein
VIADAITIIDGRTQDVRMLLYTLTNHEECCAHIMLPQRPKDARCISWNGTVVKREPELADTQSFLCYCQPGTPEPLCSLRKDRLHQHA